MQLLREITRLTEDGMLTRCLGVLFIVVLAAGAGRLSADGPAAPPTIKSIMKVAFKDGLTRKVATGKSSAEERDELLKLAQSLQKLSPPQGDAESWKKKTQAVVDAAQAAVDGKEDAPALLRTSTNCMACHDVHKPAE